MKQGINFYLDEFKPKRDPLALKIVLTYWALLLVALMLIGSVLQYQASQVSKTHQQLSQELALKQAMSTEFQSALANRAQDSQLKQQIELLKQQIQLKNNILEQVKVRTSLGHQGYAQLMFDLAKFNHKGTWLTEIQYLDDRIVLTGGAKNAELIPAWLTNLGQSHYFHDRTFKNLSLNLSENGLYTEFVVDSIAAQKGEKKEQSKPLSISEKQGVLKL